jgi:hypothetical protein
MVDDVASEFAGNDSRERTAFNKPVARSVVKGIG